MAIRKPRAPVGTRVELVVSDPWDFAKPDGSVRFEALVTRAATHREGADEERLVLKLLKPHVWHQQMVDFLVARERHGHGIVEDLSLGQPVECALVAIEAERAHGADPYDTSWWRGGLAANATLRGISSSE